MGVNRVRLPFNSRMTEIFRSSDLNEIVNEIFTQMKTIADLDLTRFYF